VFFAVELEILALEVHDDVGRLNLPQGGLWASWHTGPFFATVTGAYGDGDATTSIAPTGTGLTSTSGYRVKVATVAGETGTGSLSGR